MSENQSKARELYRKAAEKGYPEAQFKYGICLRDGKGGPTNAEEAMTWFQKAATAGYAEAKQALVGFQKPNPPTNGGLLNGIVAIITWPYRNAADFIDNRPHQPDNQAIHRDQKRADD